MKREDSAISSRLLVHNFTFSRLHDDGLCQNSTNSRNDMSSSRRCSSWQTQSYPMCGDVQNLSAVNCFGRNDSVWDDP